jgi:hypothetical protein
VSYFDDPNCEAAALAEHAVLAYAVKMEFPSGDVLLSTWTDNITINGDVYQPAGGLCSVSDVEDGVSLTAERWTYSVSAIDESAVDTVNAIVGVIPESEIDNSFRCAVTEYEVWINPDTHAVIGTEIAREGRISRISRRIGEAPMILIDCETRLATLMEADNWRYTSEHQAKFFAGDTGLDQVRELESVEIIWGGSRVHFGRHLIDALLGNHPRFRGRGG